MSLYSEHENQMFKRTSKALLAIEIQIYIYVVDKPFGNKAQIISSQTFMQHDHAKGIPNVVRIINHSLKADVNNS